MAQFIVPAIQSAGSSAKIVSYNGTPFVLDMMRDGDMVVVGRRTGLRDGQPVQTTLLAAQVH